MNITGKNIVVLGAGVSGVAAARLAKAKGAASVRLFDKADNDMLRALSADLQRNGIETCLGWQPVQALEADLAIVSPGIALTSPMLTQGLAPSCPRCSELEFGSSFCTLPQIAITGTNGKTTTVELLTHCLCQAGHKAVAVGNVGLPISALAIDQQDYEIAVVEVSTFQLETTSHLAVDCAALLNITPDHLDRHGSMEEYTRLKFKLLQLAKEDRPVVLNANLKHHPALEQMLLGRPKIYFSAHEQADFCYKDDALCRNVNGTAVKLLSVDKMQLKGDHNYENALAVLALGEAMGFTPETLVPGLRTFAVGDHRLAEVGVFEGVRYINDSKGTNVDAVVKALEYSAEDNDSEQKIILIAGGIDKGCSLEEAKSALTMYVKEVCVFGACRDRLAASWGQVVPVTVCDTLAQAVQAAKALASPGDTVLFSPGCSSFDMFQSYADRGRQFVACVKKLYGG